MSRLLRPSLRHLAARSLQSRAASSSASGSASASEAASPAPQDSAAAASSSGPAWSPALARGTELAYDEALAFLAAHRKKLAARVDELRQEAAGVTDAEEQRRLAAVIRSAEVARDVNDPETRMRFQTQDVPLSEPVFLHLHQKFWQSGPLPRLLERARNMSVIPDVVPKLTAQVDVRLAFGQGSGYTDHEAGGGEVLAGVHVPVSATAKEPTITAVPFHTEERLYTVALVDADAPDVEAQRYTSWCHWLATDVPLSATRTSVSMDAGRTLLPYVPAHPARGTDAHRMTLVLVSQEARLASPPAAPVREGFSLAAWLEQAGGEAVGLAFWRSKWAEADAAAVSQVWREYRKGEAEPAYGKAPRRSEYQAVDGSLPSRYF